MTPEQVTQVLDEIGGAEKIDANGWAYGPLRVERGGGIAGHSQEFWIRFPAAPEMKALGPFSTKKELRCGLREFFVRCIQFGHGIEALLESTR